MNEWTQTPCTAFDGARCIASGELSEVALAAKDALDRAAKAKTASAVLVFNDATSEVIELDWRGSRAAFKARIDDQQAAAAAQPGGEAARSPGNAAGAGADTVAGAARGPGRPRLGVVAREVTLLPRHWDWLGAQSGGTSVALRKLVDVARRASEAQDRVRRACTVGYKFMSTMAGHEPGFEEASRALFALDQAGFEAQIKAWPVDVQRHLKKLLTDAFAVPAKVDSDAA